VPYNIAFGLPVDENNNYDDFKYFAIFLDLVILVDIVLTFITDNSAEGEVTNMTNKIIAYRYLNGFFIFDLIGCLPGLLRSE
jgi:hypothetical protein